MSRNLLARLVVATTVAVAMFSQTLPAMAGTWPAGTHRVSLTAGRFDGVDRYTTAADSASASWRGWKGIDRVIIASGETAALADPLTAGSLCWAYDAPLLLVKRDSIPSAVKTALQQIRAANPLVDVTIVGGSSRVGPEVVEEITQIMAPGIVEQPWLKGNRYDTAAGVALRVIEVAQESSRTPPARALVANGSDALGFADALSLSAIAARTGIPVLLTEQDTLPAPIESVLSTLTAKGSVIVAGGTGAVSDAVYDQVGGSSRWFGPDRYATSTILARGARSRGWLTGSTVGLASSAPDALSGSVYMARMGGPLLVTRQESLAPVTARYLAELGGTIDRAIIFGGSAVVSNYEARELRGYPTTPVLQGPAAGTLLGKRAPIRVNVGMNTTEVQLWSGSNLVATKRASSYSTVDFGDALLPPGGTPLRVVARNADAKTSEVSRTFRQLAYPASTSIVIDKSDFRLYYVKNDVLVKSYPIAIGRPGMETPTRLWKINSKYYTDPNGVYGPRKMRLYAQSGSSWAYTAYNIHGTNQPWVIGTKASHGCIRLYNKDILDLFPRIALGTLVLTRE